MKSIILDTETHALNGKPIQIAYKGFGFEPDVDHVRHDAYYSLDDGDSIDFGAMAVHNIIPADLEGEPNYKTFRLP